jgi:hypothetical protein
MKQVFCFTKLVVINLKNRPVPGVGLAAVSKTCPPVGGTFRTGTNLVLRNGHIKTILVRSSPHLTLLNNGY